MKFRVISDLHVDVNRHYPFELKDDMDNVITLVAGDVSGDPEIDYDWLHKNTNYHGFVISGNHIVYNFKDKTIQDLQQEERDLFSKSDRWQYLEKDYKVFDDEKIIVFGATLWTDYLYNGPEQANMWDAKYNLNDFRYGQLDVNGKKVGLYPKWCKDEHIKTLEKLDKVCKDYPDYSIVVLTHHCPSGKSVTARYWGSKVNAAFVSDLSEFILNHPNIKAWACGHVHHRHDYIIGNCHVFANPYGYAYYGENNGWNQNTMNFELKDGNIIMENK